MAEYIERNAAKNAIYAAMRKHDEYDSCKRKIINGLAEADDAIDSVPAADVAPVRHGRWIETTQPMGWDDVTCAECSECGEDFVLDEWGMEDMKNLMLYCPNCGAKMDGEADAKER